MTVARVVKWQTSDGREWPSETEAAAEQRVLDLAQECARVLPDHADALARALLEAPSLALSRFLAAANKLERVR